MGSHSSDQALPAQDRASLANGTILKDALTGDGSDFIEINGERSLCDAELYACDSAKFVKATAALAKAEAELLEAEEVWLRLELLQDEMGD